MNYTTKEIVQHLRGFKEPQRGTKGTSDAVELNGVTKSVKVIEIATRNG